MLPVEVFSFQFEDLSKLLHGLVKLYVLFAPCQTRPSWSLTKISKLVDASASDVEQNTLYLFKISININAFGKVFKIPPTLHPHTHTFWVLTSVFKWIAKGNVLLRELKPLIHHNCRIFFKFNVTNIGLFLTIIIYNWVVAIMHMSSCIWSIVHLQQKVPRKFEFSCQFHEPSYWEGTIFNWFLCLHSFFPTQPKSDWAWCGA